MKKSLDHTFEISAHARYRIKQRLRTSDKKIESLVAKAWESKNVDIPKLKMAEYKAETIGRTCKCLMGYVFVFKIWKEKKILITVF